MNLNTDNLKKKRYYKSAIKYIKEHNLYLTDLNIEYYRLKLQRDYFNKWLSKNYEHRQKYLKEYYKKRKGNKERMEKKIQKERDKYYIH